MSVCVCNIIELQIHFLKADHTKYILAFSLHFFFFTYIFHFHSIIIIIMNISFSTYINARLTNCLCLYSRFLILKKTLQLSNCICSVRIDDNHDTTNQNII